MRQKSLVIRSSRSFLQTGASRSSLRIGWARAGASMFTRWGSLRASTLFSTDKPSTRQRGRNSKLIGGESKTYFLGTSPTKSLTRSSSKRSGRKRTSRSRRSKGSCEDIALSRPREARTSRPSRFSSSTCAKGLKIDFEFTKPCQRERRKANRFGDGSPLDFYVHLKLHVRPSCVAGERLAGPQLQSHKQIERS